MAGWAGAASEEGRTNQFGNTSVSLPTSSLRSHYSPQKVQRSGSSAGAARQRLGARPPALLATPASNVTFQLHRGPPLSADCASRPLGKTEAAPPSLS